MLEVASRHHKPTDYLLLSLRMPGGDRDTGTRTAQARVLVECVRADRDRLSHGEGAVGVAPDAFGGITLPEDAKVVWRSTSKAEWTRYRIRSDPSLKLATLGIVLALLGVLIDAAFALGEIAGVPHIVVSPSTAFVLKIAKFVLIAVGLWLTYRRGVLDAVNK